MYVGFKEMRVLWGIDHAEVSSSILYNFVFLYLQENQMIVAVNL